MKIPHTASAVEAVDAKILAGCDAATAPVATPTATTAATATVAPPPPSRIIPSGWINGYVSGIRCSGATILELERFHC